MRQMTSSAHSRTSAMPSGAELAGVGELVEELGDHGDVQRRLAASPTGSAVPRDRLRVVLSRAHSTQLANMP